MLLGNVLAKLASRLKPKQDDKRAPDNSASHMLLTEYYSQLTINSLSTHSQLTVNSQSTHAKNRVLEHTTSQKTTDLILSVFTLILGKGGLRYDAIWNGSVERGKACSPTGKINIIHGKDVAGVRHALRTCLCEPYRD